MSAALHTYVYVRGEGGGGWVFAGYGGLRCYGDTIEHTHTDIHYSTHSVGGVHEIRCIHEIVGTGFYRQVARVPIS